MTQIIEKLNKILQIQQTNGSWNFKDLKDCIEYDQKVPKDILQIISMQNFTKQTYWATAIALSLLEVEFTQFYTKWVHQHSIGLKYLKMNKIRECAQFRKQLNSYRAENYNQSLARPAIGAEIKKLTQKGIIEKTEISEITLIRNIISHE